MNKRDRKKAIRKVLDTWTDDETKRAFEWTENGLPILVGCDQVRESVLCAGKL